MRVILALSFFLLVLLAIVFPSFRPWSSSGELDYLKARVKELKQDLEVLRNNGADTMKKSSAEAEEVITTLKEKLRALKRQLSETKKEGNSAPCETSKPQECAMMLNNTFCGDRSPGDVFIDLSYRFRYNHEVHQLHTDHTAQSVMEALHNGSVYKHPTLKPLIKLVGADIQNEIGSHLAGIRDHVPKVFRENKPKICFEIGCFRGGGSVRIAKLLETLSEEIDDFQDAFVISIDSWLLDLDFTWPRDNIFKKADPTYFAANPRIAGMQTMYLTFLDNVMRNNLTHRIVPLPSTSMNAALAMISHKIRPQFIYLDASHANPDVMLDIVTWWELLEPGRYMVLDDHPIWPVKFAATAFLVEKASEIESSEVLHRQMWILKKK